MQNPEETVHTKDIHHPRKVPVNAGKVPVNAGKVPVNAGKVPVNDRKSL